MGFEILIVRFLGRGFPGVTKAIAKTNIISTFCTIHFPTSVILMGSCGRLSGHQFDCVKTPMILQNRCVCGQKHLLDEGFGVVVFG